MTKSTITRERLEWLSQISCRDDIEDIGGDEIRELASIALAAMDSEPVAYISKSDFNAGYPHILARRDFNKACTMPVYAEQPAPVVPDEIKHRIGGLDWGWEGEFNRGWNACRAAMLAAAPQSPGSEPATVPGKWIPVSEQMPENDGAYLCWDNRYVTTYAFIFGAWQANQFVAKNITHWMPLPAAPQEVNRE
ncbi:TPA: DUF551 domain-containing protein [Klebsiella pneumoniae]|nr:DUF551 domain-containing protein [Klebsiella pneumoniae subsp. ozaenae]AXZ21759.1 DUF551 domain-containing protein [Klebsiella pneumoniae]ROE28699.1 DUF551 domain-containing protein [Klebsiella pneumoniae subsp. pneumoniae]EIX9642051.1 DUF551 domain-containing protein [Klebsiella pneumoniae]MBC4959065.1 DUF551 domain-containing protein [Klebsiella pneumoniae]